MAPRKPSRARPARPGGVLVFKVARGAVNRIGRLVIAYLAGWVLLASVLQLSPVWLPVGCVALMMGLLVYLNLPGRLELGSDGVHVDLRGEERFVPLSDIEHVRVESERRGGKSFVGVGLWLASGEVFRIPLGEDNFGASDRAALIAKHVAERVKGQGTPAPLGGREALARGESSLDVWVRRLRSIGAGANAGPREAPILPERLLRIVEDSGTEPAARAAAAVALAPHLDADGRARVACAADSTALPKLRVALAAVAEDDESAALEALAELDRKVTRV